MRRMASGFVAAAVVLSGAILFCGYGYTRAEDGRQAARTTAAHAMTDKAQQASAAADTAQSSAAATPAQDTTAPAAPAKTDANTATPAPAKVMSCCSGTAAQKSEGLTSSSSASSTSSGCGCGCGGGCGQK